MGTDIALRTENIIAPIRGEMVELSGSEEAANRIAHSFSIAVRETPKILECSPPSIQKEIMKCCSDGLVPDSKEAVILPYFNKDTKQLEANYQPMVYGVIKRMKELSSVCSIAVDVVHENDEFHVNLADVDDTVHKFDIFSDDRGEIVGAYCIARDKDKNVIHREIMTRKDLDKIRTASKSPNSPAWKNWETEMFKKGVLRRLSKYISLDNDKLRKMVESIDDFFDYKQRQESVRADPFAPKQIGSSGNNSIAPNEEEGGPHTSTPSSNVSSAKAHSSLESTADEKASDGGKVSPSDASNSKPLVTLDEIQAFSDHLWRSQRTKFDINADTQQFKADNLVGKSVKGNGRKLLAQVKKIHEDRVTGNNAATADKLAADQLAELGFEIPSNILEDA